MSGAERFLREFHAARPGITSRAFGRGGSYERLAAEFSGGARVLDLACGDGALLRLLGPRSVGIDLAPEEVARAGERAVCGRAQALPFADRAFDGVACHLAFMLFDDVARVVAELDRVLVPGGAFVAVLGGGPTAHDDDAHHRFLDLLDREPRAIPPLGDPRARTEAGWRALFAGWDVAPFVRCELDLGGSADDVWQFLSAAYELPPHRAAEIRATLRATLGDGPVPCRAVVFLARATKPR